jgi:demethylmenaquinone methyltransferase/2-methoxy-6-polyprenyl-1,4-benzoquinol methylase
MTAPTPDRGQLAPHPTLAEYYGEDGNRPAFIRALFDHSAPSYDRIEKLVGFGSGPWYRREALGRAGLVSGMRSLDVAIGTGLVAREAIRLLGDSKAVVGLDPSMGMLAEARHNLGVMGVQGMGEQLPLCGERFDFVSMGYALRHLADLTVTFREFGRVLKPGGTICILELTKPAKPFARAVLRFYLHSIVPFFTRLTTRSKDNALLMRYFWDTINSCVPPEVIVRALADAGFVAIRRCLALGLFSEYVARKPGPGVEELAEGQPRVEGNFFLRTFTHPLSSL